MIDFSLAKGENGDVSFVALYVYKKMKVNMK